MKMGVSTALKLILSKIVNPCLTMSAWIKGTHLFLFFKWLKKWKSTSKHQFLRISIMHLGTYHAHTLLYPRCTWKMLGTVFTHHSTAMDKSRIVSCWISKTSSTIYAVFTCPQSAGLKGAVIMVDANPLLNSLHPLPTWCSISTPSPNTSINVKCDSFHIILVFDILSCTVKPTTTDVMKELFTNFK